MFKKKQGKRKNLRRRSDDDDDEAIKGVEGSEAATVDSNGITSSTTYEQIQRQKKRRLLIESVQYKRGVSAANLLKKVHVPLNLNDSSAQVDDTAAHTNETDHRREGVLEAKHRQAMEDFIEKNAKLHAENKTGETENLESDSPVVNTTERLYEQLAEASMRLAGRTNTSNNSLQSKDADVGSGGALAAGTGLAEVVLPVAQRLKAVEATAKAIQDSKSCAGDSHRLPSSRSHGQSGPSRFSIASQSATIAPIAREEEVPDGDKNANADRERLGFEAFQKQKAGDSQSTQRNAQRGKIQRSTDDRAFKNFVTQQREKRQNR